MGEEKLARERMFSSLLIVFTLLASLSLACNLSASQPPEPGTSATQFPQPSIENPTQPVPPEVDIGTMLQQALDGLSEGRLLFNPPTEMRQGKKERIELRIMPIQSDTIESEIQATLEAGLKGSGVPQVEPVKVGTIMKARLSGDGFAITPLNEEEQIVASDAFTEWAWDATAMEAGERELNLKVTVRIIVQGFDEGYKDWPVTTKTVRVRVDPLFVVKTFIGDYWQWIFTTLLIPVAVGFYKLYSNKKAVKKDAIAGSTTQARKQEAVNYLDFDLEVEAVNGQAYSVRARSQAGEARETVLFPLEGVELENRLKSFQASLPRALGDAREGPPVKKEAVKRFGEELFSFLMSGGIKSQYDLLRQMAEIHDTGVRIKLRILSPEIAAFPWEYLYDPSERDYISLSRDTPLVRYLDLPRPIESLAIQLPLRILVMVANPRDLPQLNVEQEKRRIEQAVRSLSANGMVELSWVNGRTWRDLQREMRSGPWHVFHFIGHGLFDSDVNEGSLALEQEDGMLHLLSATQLARLLADHNSLRLVVLNACESGQGGNQELFSGTASILVKRGVPAVVAMQTSISDRAAIEFARSFYEALADSVPVDAAVAEARKAMAIEDTFEWGIPVLFMHTSNGVLFQTR